MSVLSGVKRTTVVCKGVERFIDKMLVRISGSIPTMGEAEERPIQSRGGIVSEATAITELVVVEALRMSNSLCKAIEEPPYMAGVRNKRRRKRDNRKALERSRPPV